MQRRLKLGYKAIMNRLKTVSSSNDSLLTELLVWLNGLQTQRSHSLQHPCNQKDTHLKICFNKSLYKKHTNSHAKRRGHKSTLLQHR